MACEVCGIPLHLGVSAGSPTCVAFCPSFLCERGFCQTCVMNHKHRVHIEDVHFPSWRSLLSATTPEDMYVELQGMEVHMTRSHDLATQCGEVYIKVCRMQVAGLTLEFDDAHISLVDVILEACPQVMELRTMQLAERLFNDTVQTIRQRLRRWERHQASGRLTWNGLYGSPCCFELRNDTLGTEVSKLVSAFNIFPVAADQPRRSVSYDLPGRNLHISLKLGFAITRDPMLVTWPEVRHALGLTFR